MKIALINENSQAAKNGIIEAALKKVVEPMGHEVVNYGMYAADDAAQLTYVQCGILAAILLNSGAADYVITGCGTGEGYPKERVEPKQRNKKILDGVRAATFKPLIECLKSIDQDLLKGAIAGEKFSELFFASCRDEELAAYIKSLLA